jgi:transcriptional regulator with XRE-family HTH domain
MVSLGIRRAFASELKEAMDNTDYSTGDIARYIGVRQGTVSNYLSGHRFPGENDFKGLQELLGVVWPYTSRRDCLTLHEGE